MSKKRFEEKINVAQIHFIINNASFWHLEDQFEGFEYLLLSDIEEYIRANITQPLPALMAKISSVIKGRDPALERWVDQTIENITHTETERVITYLSNISEADFNTTPFREALTTWLIFLALQPEVKSRTSYFSLYNLVFIYAISCKFGDSVRQIPPSCYRKIKLRNTEDFKTEVIGVLLYFLSKYKKEHIITAEAIRSINEPTIVSALTSIAHQIISKSQQIQRERIHLKQALPIIKIELPPAPWVSADDIGQLIRRIEKVQAEPKLTKASIKKFIVRTEKLQIREAKKELAQEQKELESYMQQHYGETRYSSRRYYRAQGDEVVKEKLAIIQELEKCIRDLDPQTTGGSTYCNSSRKEPNGPDDPDDPYDPNDPEYIASQYIKYRP